MDERLLEDLLRRITRLERGMVDLIKPEVPRWVDWTPTVTQNGAVSATVENAAYMTSGDLVIAYARLTVTGTGTAGNVITIESVPAIITPIDTSTTAIGVARLNVNATRYASVVLGVATGYRFQNNGQASPVGLTPSFALAANDVISFSVTYRRA